MRTVLFALVLLWCGVGVAGERAQADQKGDKPVEQQEELVCERKKVVGSNRTERVCLTASQHAAAKEKAQADLQRLGRCSGNDSMCSGTL